MAFPPTPGGRDPSVHPHYAEGRGGTELVGKTGAADENVLPDQSVEFAVMHETEKLSVSVEFAVRHETEKPSVSEESFGQHGVVNESFGETTGKGAVEGESEDDGKRWETTSNQHERERAAMESHKAYACDTPASCEGTAAHGIGAAAWSAKGAPRAQKFHVHREAKEKTEVDTDFDVEAYIKSFDPPQQEASKQSKEELTEQQVADGSRSTANQSRLIEVNRQTALHRSALRREEAEAKAGNAVTYVGKGVTAHRVKMKLTEEQLHKIEANKSAAQKLKAQKIEMATRVGGKAEQMATKDGG